MKPTKSLKIGAIDPEQLRKLAEAARASLVSLQELGTTVAAFHEAAPSLTSMRAIFTAHGWRGVAGFDVPRPRLPFFCQCGHIYMIVAGPSTRHACGLCKRQESDLPLYECF